MLQVDEDIAWKPLKDIENLDLMLSKTPTKALYKLLISVTQEVQSRDRIDAVNLETTQEEKETLEIVLKEVQLERDK
jgi:hypothetical protein